jgi:hypothetical protein
METLNRKLKEREGQLGHFTLHMREERELLLDFTWGKKIN